jgi:multidrug resistance efflux pump
MPVLESGLDLATTFVRTFRAVEADRVPWRVAVGCLAVLFPFFVVWVFAATVTVYEVSSSARLEVKTEPYHVATFVEGRVIRSDLQIGQPVAIDEVLVVLDGEIERRAIDERKRHKQSLLARRVALTDEIEAEQSGIKAAVKAREMTRQESEAELAVADARAKYARLNLERVTRLATQKVATPDEVQKLQSENDVAESTAKQVRLTAARHEIDRTADESDRRARLAKLMREATDLEGEAEVDDATIERLKYNLELRTIRAPAEGRIEEVGPFRVGSVVRAAEKLGTIIPIGEPRLVAYFPEAAVGRIRVDQPARLRLDGFPWTQYGTLSSRVSRVGNESRNGQIRVDLILLPGPDSRIPVQHGLTGSVEVAVDAASPGVLMLRAAGQYLTSRRAENRTAQKAEP